MAQSLRDGDPDALARICDAYAARLYDYCHALLRDHDSAAYALHDALIAAHAHVAGLREPEHFRGWLYALVRSESLHRLNAPDRPVERHEAPAVEDLFTGAEERARREETRELVHSALSGLTGRQREAVDLTTRHELDTGELSGVLGLSAEEAAELAEQAHGVLDDALAAALIARTGRESCPSVAALVETWEWPLTPTACRKLIRHIGTCPTCGDLRRRGASVTGLLEVLPVALMPAWLPERVLTTATDPDLADERAEIAELAGPFDVWGWPVHADDGDRRAAAGRRTAQLWPAVAAAACVIAMVGAGFLWMPRSTGQGAHGVPSPGAAAPAISDPVNVAPSEPETEPPTPTPRPSTSSSSPAVPRTTVRPPRPRPTRPVPKPSTTRPSPRPRPGTLTVTGCGDIGSGTSCDLTVTAVGGPVIWRVAGAEGVTAAGSGRLLAGGQSSVHVTRPDCAPQEERGSGSVSFSPNGSAAVSWVCKGA
jgi:RNA polymerase sigma factor (sigma-70 family)